MKDNSEHIHIHKHIYPVIPFTVTTKELLENHLKGWTVRKLNSKIGSLFIEEIHFRLIKGEPMWWLPEVKKVFQPREVLCEV